jgi:hypothetical protein
MDAKQALCRRLRRCSAVLTLGPIVGAYEMRVGDAHPTGSKIGEALELAGVEESATFLKQGEQLIYNFGKSIWWIGKLLFGQGQG